MMFELGKRDKHLTALKYASAIMKLIESKK